MSGEQRKREGQFRSGVRGACAVLGVLALARPAQAELPDYTLQIQARTNLSVNPSGAYNLEPGNLLPGSLQVPITGDRKVAFQLAITPEGRRGMWWGQEGVGSRIYLLPYLGGDELTSDPGINSMGDMAFAVYGGTSGNGIYRLNVADPGRVSIFAEPVGATSWSSLWLNEAGQVGFRATFSFSGRAYVLLEPSGAGYETKFLAKEQGIDPSSPYTFLYSPTLNDLGQMAGVADRAPNNAEYFQELHVWSANGTSQLLVQSRGLNPASPVYRFASVQPALNNTGMVAFQGIAKNASNQNVVTIWRWDGATLQVIAQNGQNGIQEVEAFPPDMNDSGLVVFRARNTSGLRAVWVSDGVALKRVVTEHDIIPSDLGEARVDQETTSNPVFAGAPMINARGDVSFVAGLAPPDNDQIEWGTAIYVARSSLPPPGQPDGGTAPDAGSGTPDAGTGMDGGTAPDAGTGTDGGSAPDAGTGTPDAGTGMDGGTAPDAGTGTPDAGPVMDGGSGSPDAGTGTPDAGPVADGGSVTDGGPVATPDGGPSETPDSGTGTDAGPTPTLDAGPGEMPDAGQTPDAGGPGDDGPGTGVPDSGCGCQSTPMEAMWPWMLLGLARMRWGRRRAGSDHS